MNGLDNFPPVDKSAHFFIGQRLFLDRAAAAAGGQLQPAAQPAVDLDDNLAALRAHRPLVGLRPGAVHQRRLVPEAAPQAVHDVRRHRRHHFNNTLVALGQDAAPLGAVAGGGGETRQRVAQFHVRGNRRVERQAARVIVADLGDGRVNPAAHFAARGGVGARARRRLRAHTAVRRHLAPEALQKTVAALDAGVRPFQRLLRRRREHHEQAHGVGAVALDVGRRIHGVAARLRHLGAVLQHHALGQQAFERLVALDEAEVAHQLVEKARVEQVQHRVLDAADIVVHRQPVGGLVVGDGGGAGGAGETHIVPT